MNPATAYTIYHSLRRRSRIATAVVRLPLVSAGLVPSRLLHSFALHNIAGND
ncbi:MAG: hypothetical protein K2M55_03955 [Muribaculaceae bacterium]|nr:hypothetical protein [Muribaculaceae bacterium]